MPAPSSSEPTEPRSSSTDQNKSEKSPPEDAAEHAPEKPSKDKSVPETLMDATKIATIFLDRDLRIQRYTPRVTELFNIQATDLGRPLADFTQRFAYEGLLDDARVVLEDLTPLEREIRRTSEASQEEVGTSQGEAAEEKWFLLRIRPSCTAQDKIDGVVLTFVDITEHKRLERKLRTEKEQLDVAVEKLPLVLFRMDTDLRFTWLKNPSEDFEDVEVLGRREDEFLPPEAAETLMAPKRRALESGERVREEVTYELPSRQVTYDLTVSPIRDESEKITGLACAALDITERKEAERELRRRAELDAFRVELTDAIRPLSDPEEIQRVAARVLGERLDVDRAHYGEVLKDGTTNRIHADYCREGVESVVGEHNFEEYGEHIAETLQAGETLVLNDVSALPDLSDEKRAAHRQVDIAAYVSVPLIKDGRLIAYCGVTQGTPREWADTEVEMVEETVERTWAAVEQAQAKRELADELEAMKRLQELSTQSIQPNDGEVLYEAVLATAADLLDAEFGSLQRLDSEANELELLAHHGFTEAAESAWAQVTVEDATTCGMALQTEERVVVSDVEASELMAGTDDQEIYLQTGIRAVQTTPLVSRDGDVLGMLSTHWAEPHEPSERDRHLLDVLARQVADLMQQRSTIDALRESEERYRTLFENDMVPMGVWTAEGDIVDANDAFLDLLGYTREELGAGELDWGEITPAAYRRLDQQAASQIEETGSAAPYEKEFIHKDGHRVPVVIGGGEFDARQDQLIFFAIDITERRELQEMVVNASEKVRRDIGRELHDVLSSDLAALAMRADNLRRELGAEEAGSDRALETLDEIVQGIRTAAKRSRTLSHTLMPAALQEQDLAAALENLCREQEKLGEPAPTFEGASEEPVLERQETAMHLYRIAREAITNAQRHAEAEHIWVRLSEEDGRLALTVRDDGVGFSENTDPESADSESTDLERADPESVDPEGADTEGGVGLQTMEYRAGLIGATLQVGSAEAGGTLVRCTLPLEKVS